MDPDRLKAQPDPNTIVAVAVGRNPDHTTHAVLVYRDLSRRNEFLYLGWHNKLCTTPSGECFAYADIDASKAGRWIVSASQEQTTEHPILIPTRSKCSLLHAYGRYLNPW